MQKIPKHVPGGREPAQYGAFSEDGLSYTVTTTETPRPWCNLLGNHRIAGLFSQCGQGFVWYLAHSYEQVTNWQEFQYFPSRLSRGRLVFIKDRDTGEYWVGNPQPGETGFRNFSCAVEPGVSTIRAERRGIAFTMRAFIPWDDDVEIWTVTLRNTTRRTQRLSIVPVVEFPTRRIHWYFRPVYLADIETIHFVDADYKRPTGAFFACSAKVHSYELSSRRFYGPLNDRLHPAGIQAGLSCAPCHNEWCVGALEIRVVLKPGRDTSFHVYTGRALEEREVRRCVGRFRRPGAVEEAVTAARRRWAAMRERLQTVLPDKTMQDFFNCWGQYCVDITTRFRQGSKIGYRDTLQCARAYLALDPDAARDMLLEALRYQYACGRSIRGWVPGTGDLDLRDARDGVSWIADTLAAYVKETGEYSILDRTVPYLDKGRGTVWEHAVGGVDFLFNHRGRHRMCLVGGGDWNDALELGGKRGRGESVWLTIATCRALRYMTELAERTSRQRQAAVFRRWRAELARDVNKYAWDGRWYIYGFTDDGRPVGTSAEREGAIYANVQTWALMEKIVPRSRLGVLWKSIEDYLCTDVGVVVLHPVYTRYRPEIGRITAMPHGHFENAAAYVHGSAFYIAALAAHGKAEEAMEYWHRARPTNPLNRHSGCEPYGCTTYYAGPGAIDFGFSPNSWFTGSVAWLFFVALEDMLGVKPDYEGLRVQPCLPASWRSYAVVRRFRGATYEITVQKTGSGAGAIRRLTADGKPMAGPLVPAASGGYHVVDVLLD